MRVQKLRGTTNGQGLAKAYNETVQPEVVPEHNDPYRVEWTEVGGSGEGEKIEKRGYVIGDQVNCVPASFHVAQADLRNVRLLTLQILSL